MRQSVHETARGGGLGFGLTESLELASPKIFWPLVYNLGKTKNSKVTFAFAFAFAFPELWPDP